MASSRSVSCLGCKPDRRPWSHAHLAKDRIACARLPRRPIKEAPGVDWMISTPLGVADAERGDGHRRPMRPVDALDSGRVQSAATARARFKRCYLRSKRGSPINSTGRRRGRQGGGVAEPGRRRPGHRNPPKTHQGVSTDISKSRRRHGGTDGELAPRGWRESEPDILKCKLREPGQSVTGRLVKAEP